ncbi:DUF3158 family protein [Pseudomonas lopnurensis]|uniref:DUF3158 family protein n=1 Tax=Pseudomonas lopnurensis TaxID=1477517 RepID=UPI0028B09CC4|nr:DUF3158 family protein [Pseudomonas lopnurensis]
MAHESSLEEAHDLFRRMAHDSSLKGFKSLLKPFKGKGDFLELELSARGALDKLNTMMQRLVSLTEHQHVSHKNIVLRLHKAKSGQSYLRWRTLKHAADQSMGTRLWTSVVNDPLTGPQTRQNLLILEQQRNALNMQASVMQYIARQAADCAKKADLAQQTVNS